MASYGSNAAIVSTHVTPQEELERQRVEAQRRLEERSGQLNAKEKEALLEQFKKDQVNMANAKCLYANSAM